MKKKYNRIHLGDSGTSHVGVSNKRLAKNDPLFDFYGTGDKFIAVLNLVLLYVKDEKTRTLLTWIIESSYQIMGIVDRPAEESATALQEILKKIEEEIMKRDYSSKIKKFILTFDTPLAAYLNYARTVAREWERTYYKITLPFNPHIARVLNRLSTLLFELVLEATRHSFER